MHCASLHWLGRLSTVAMREAVPEKRLVVGGIESTNRNPGSFTATARANDGSFISDASLLNFAFRVYLVLRALHFRRALMLDIVSQAGISHAGSIFAQWNRVAMITFH